MKVALSEKSLGALLAGEMVVAEDPSGRSVAIVLEDVGWQAMGAALLDAMTAGGMSEAAAICRLGMIAGEWHEGLRGKEGGR